MVRLIVIILLLQGIVFTVADSTHSDDECAEDSDCRPLNSWEDEIWEHKDLFPLEPAEVGATVMIIIFSAMANAGGTGGAGIMIVIIITIFSFEVHMALPLSVSTVFGGCIASIFVKFWHRHPHRDRPVIDWWLSMQFLPLMLFGTIIGVFFNIIFPEWLLLVLLTALMIYLSILAAKKSKQIWQAEKIVQQPTVKPTQDEADLATPGQDEDSPVVNRGQQEQEIEVQNESAVLVEGKSEELQAIESQEAARCPIKPLLIFVLVYFLIIMYVVVEGDEDFESIAYITKCSGPYWGVLIGLMVLCIAVTFLTSWILLRRNKQYNDAEYDWYHQDMQWNLKKVVLMPILGFGAGIASGMLGIGGGLILGPFMLTYGLNPEAAAATGPLLIVCTATVALIMFAMSGRLIYSYAAWCCWCSIIGSVMGITLLKRLTEKYKRTSPLSIMLTIILVLSALIIPSFGIYIQTYKSERGTAEWGFHEPC